MDKIPAHDSDDKIRPRQFPRLLNMVEMPVVKRIVLGDNPGCPHKSPPKNRYYHYIYRGAEGKGICEIVKKLIIENLEITPCIQ